MSYKVKLDDGTEYVITDQAAQALNQAIVQGKQFVRLNGSTVRVSAIKHVDSFERESVPIHRLSAPRATPWKSEQWAELSKRYKSDTKPGSLKWLETEEEFRAAMVGEWPKF